MVSYAARRRKNAVTMGLCTLAALLGLMWLFLILGVLVWKGLSGLSLAVGVAVVRALEDCGASGVMLKWPNDILFGHAKLGGVLVELHAEPDTAMAVIGIGLNLRLPETIGEPSVAALPAPLLLPKHATPSSVLARGPPFA